MSICVVVAASHLILFEDEDSLRRLQVFPIKYEKKREKFNLINENVTQEIH